MRSSSLMMRGFHTADLVDDFAAQRVVLGLILLRA